jgi:hypothetical protein
MKITHDQFIKLLAAELGDNEKITSIRVLGLISEINRAIEGGGKYEINGFGTFHEKGNRLSFTPSQSLASEVNINYAGFMPLDVDASRLSESDDIASDSEPTKPKVVKSGILIVDDDVADEEDVPEIESGVSTKDTSEDDPFGIAPFDPNELVLDDEPKPSINLISDEIDDDEKEALSAFNAKKKEAALADDDGVEDFVTKTNTPASNESAKKAELDKNSETTEKVDNVAKSAVSKDPQALEDSSKKKDAKNDGVKLDANANKKAEIVKKEPVSAKTDSKKETTQPTAKTEEKTVKEKQAATAYADKKAVIKADTKKSADKDSKPSSKPPVIADSSAAKKTLLPDKKVQEISKPNLKDVDLGISEMQPAKPETKVSDKDSNKIAASASEASKPAFIEPVAKGTETKLTSEKQHSGSKKAESDGKKENVSTSVDAKKALKMEQRKERHLRRKPDSSLKYVFAAVAVVLIVVFAWWYVTDQGSLEPTAGELPVAGVSQAMIDQDQESEAANDGVASATISGPAQTSTPAATAQQPAITEQPTRTEQPATTQATSETASGSQTRATITEDQDVYAGEQWENQRALTPILGGMFGLEGESRVIQGRVFSIIVHSVPNQNDANRARNEIVALGLRSLVVEARGPQGQRTYRVGIGQFPSIEEAERALLFLPEPYRSRNFVARVN